MSTPLPPLLKAAKKELERMGYTVTATADNGHSVDHSGSAIRVTEPATYEVPEGMSYDPETGILSGAPTKPGTYHLTLPLPDTPPPRRALKAPDEDAPVTGREDW